MRNLFMLWVFVLFVELYWFYYDDHKGGADNTLIYLSIGVTLIVGITGLTLYRKKER